MATKKAMKLINADTGEMECKHCGSRHFAKVRPMSNGNFYRGSWQCSNPNCPSKGDGGQPAAELD